jgi:hypothetical protein
MTKNTLCKAMLLAFELKLSKLFCISHQIISPPLLQTRASAVIYEDADHKGTIHLFTAVSLFRKNISLIQ